MRIDRPVAVLLLALGMAVSWNSLSRATQPLLPSPAQSSPQSASPPSPLLPAPPQPTAPTAELTALENLPTGQYYYQEPPLRSSAQTSLNAGANAPHQLRQGYLLLRKAGHSVIGIDRRLRSRHACFRGFVEGDRIISTMRVFPPYRPDARWERQADMVDLSRYQRVNRVPTAAEKTALQDCLAFFSH